MNATIRVGHATKRTMNARFSTMGASMMKPTNNTIPGAHLPTKAVLRPLEAPVVPHASHFLSTIFPRSLTDHLPFQVPTNSILSTVGGTPISEIQPGLWAKLEGFNFSGSIKDRAILCTVLKMIEQGTLKSGSTLVLITSGSAGVSLGMIQKALAEDCRRAQSEGERSTIQ